MRIVLVLALLLAPACKSASNTPPPNLSPQAQVAWQATRVIRALDALRDIAVDANKTNPPAISTDFTRKIVEWHRSAIITAKQAPQGWQTTIATGLTETVRSLPEKERQQLSPYMTLVMTVLQEVNQQ